MEERSNIQLNWHGTICPEFDGSKYVLRGLRVRWNEQQVEREDGEVEYVYEVYVVDVELPPEVQPGQEAVEFYLEVAQDAVLQLAQDLAAQEAGFQ